MTQSRPSQGSASTTRVDAQRVIDPHGTSESRGGGIPLGSFAGISDTRVRVLFEAPTKLVLEAALTAEPDKLFIADLVDWASWLEQNPAAIWSAFDDVMAGRKRPAEVFLVLRLIVPKLDDFTENRVRALRFPVEVLFSAVPKTTSRKTATPTTPRLFNWPGRDADARPCVIRRKGYSGAPTITPYIDPRIDSLWAALCDAVHAQSRSPSARSYRWEADPDVTGLRAYALLVTLGMNLMVIQATQSLGAGKLTAKVGERIDAMLKVILWVLRAYIANCAEKNAESKDRHLYVCLPESVISRITDYSASVAVQPGELPDCWIEPLPPTFEGLIEAMAYPATSAVGPQAVAPVLSKLTARDSQLLVQANFGVAAAVEVGVASDQGASIRPRGIKDRAFLVPALVRIACAHRILLELYGIAAPTKHVTLGVLNLVAAIARIATNYATSLLGASTWLLADRMQKSVRSLASSGRLGSQGKTAKGAAKARDVEQCLLKLLETLV